MVGVAVAVAVVVGVVVVVGVAVAVVVGVVVVVGVAVAVVVVVAVGVVVAVVVNLKKAMPRVSSGDSGARHPYLIPRLYRKIVCERLLNDRGYLGPEYIKLLEKQRDDCTKQMERRALI